MSGSEEGYFGGPKWFSGVMWLFAILAVAITLLEGPLTIIGVAAGALVLILLAWEVSFSFTQSERRKNIFGTIAVCAIGVVLSVALGMLNAYWCLFGFFVPFVLIMTLCLVCIIWGN